MARVFVLLFILTSLSPLFASTNEVDQLIQQMGAETYKERETASKALWKMGIDAVPALERAIEKEDPEIKIRATEVMEKLTRGEIPGLSKELQETLKTFHESTGNAQHLAFSNLFDAKEGLAVAWILVKYQMEDPEDAVSTSSLKLLNLAREQILTNDLAVAESCLRLRTLGSYRGAEADLAVFLALLPGEQDKDESAEVNTRRALVRGEFDSVLEQAEEGDAHQETVLRIKGDWKQLALIHEEKHDEEDIRDLGVRATYHRLAGSDAFHQQALADIKAHADNTDNIWYPAEAFLLNDQFEQAIAMLADAGDYRAVDLAWRISDYQTILDFKSEDLSEDEKKRLAYVQKRIKDPDPWKAPEPLKPEEEEELSEFAKLIMETDPQTEEDWLKLKRWPLGDHRVWHGGMRSVTEQLSKEQNRIAHDWSVQCGLADDWGHMDAIRKWHWSRAVEAGKFKEAENLFERHRLPLHVRGFKYNKPYYYLVASSEIFYLNVLQVIEEERREDLPRIMEDFSPLFPQWSEKFVNDLRKRGHDDVAAMIHDHARRYLKPKLKRFPKCASLHNGFAWQVALSRTNLEEGLAASERSLKLIPGNPQFLDTKAEILFQMKRDEDALKVIKEATELQPDNEYYQRQLKRMKAGERDTPPE